MADQDADAPIPATLPPKKQRPEWLAWAIGSGAFAAFNGVFAKLTTADTTHTIAASISSVFGLSSPSPVIEILFRGIFFGLNLLSNAIMWILFTRALTAATSTTQVSILNTSANFMVTAILGLIVFGEKLPFGWWMGASLLVAGSVVIGAREGRKTKETSQDTGNAIGVDSIALEADTIAVGLGAGGVDAEVVSQGRFKDDTSEEFEDGNYSDEQSRSSNGK